MDEIRQEIERRFAYGSPGRAAPLHAMPAEHPAWVVRTGDGQFGVAVPYNGKPIHEEFTSVTYCTITDWKLGEMDQPLLVLLSDDEAARNEFSLLCTDFVNPGSDGSRRIQLCEQPTLWWTRWKTLLGNTARERRPESILAELLICEFLQSAGESVSWTPSATHSLRTSAFDADVACSTARYANTLRVRGERQLETEADALYLYFVRLEGSPVGICLDDVVGRMSTQREDLERKLRKCGYPRGASARSATYAVLDTTRYVVDETFPRIVPDMFVAGHLPDGISRLAYDVDLSVLTGEPLPVADRWTGLYHG